MSEHAHDWDIYIDFDDRIRARCACGADESWNVLKEQLQRAQDEAHMWKVRYGELLRLHNEQHAQ